MFVNNTEYLSMTEMAQECGVCYNVFSRWVKTGVIEPEFVNPSGRRYFTREQVDAYFRGEYSTKGKAN